MPPSVLGAEPGHGAMDTRNETAHPRHKHLNSLSSQSGRAAHYEPLMHRGRDVAAPCRLCDRGPAAMTSVFEHHGYGVPLRHLVLRGPLCRQCGLVAWRRMTLQTVLLGWWGLASVLFTPVTLGLNTVALVKLLRTPAAPATPADSPGWIQVSSSAA